MITVISEVWTKNNDDNENSKCGPFYIGQSISELKAKELSVFINFFKLQYPGLSSKIVSSKMNIYETFIAVVIVTEDIDVEWVIHEKPTNLL